MFRLRHVLLITLLCLALPVQGVAGLIGFQQACPMQAAHMQHQSHEASHGQQFSSNKPDCCGKPSAKQNLHDSCKMQAGDCRVGGGTGLLTVYEFRGLASQAAVLHSVLAHPLYEFNLASIWRPPSAISLT